MTTRQRSRSTRGAPPPVIAENSLEQISGNGAATDSAESADLPEIKLSGEPVATSREARIAIAAYQRAERRNFEPGQELDDWLAAEREVDALTFGAGTAAAPWDGQGSREH